jgi:two-component system LytT family response regulator/two-component system response regulator LytT
MSTPLHNVLIVEDEQPSRDALFSLVQRIHADTQIVAVENTARALESVMHQNFDLVFLDINLPGQNGIEFAENLLKLAAPPLIIFATASDRHAVRGFELNIIDYIVKPFQECRVRQALARVEHILASKEASEQHHRSVQAVVDESLTCVNKLWAERENGARVLVAYDDIGWASASNKEVFIRTASEELSVRLTLGALQALLPENTFVRVHRSHLVNINLAREVITWDSHSMTLIMGDRNQTEIPVSRKYAFALKQIGGW